MAMSFFLYASSNVGASIGSPHFGLVLAKVGGGGNATLEDGVLDAAVREIVGSGHGCRECGFSRCFVDVDCV
jgi:hypothetical protein